MSVNRLNKINEEIKKELSAIIARLKDPRVSSAVTSVVSAEVTRDMRWCKVFISVFGDDKAKSDTIDALKSAAGFIRRELSGALTIRYTPELVFELDHSIEYGAHINQVISSLEINTDGEES